MDAEIARILVESFIVPVGTALAVAVGGWIAARLPGPIKDSLYSAIHKRDVELLLGAMARRAAAQKSAAVATGHGAEDLIAYVRQELPGLVAKMQLSEQALQTVAGATLVKAEEPAAVVLVPGAAS